MKLVKLFLTMSISVVLISTIFCQGLSLNENNDSEKFYLWAISDTHGAYYWDDDVSFDGNLWSGNLVSEDVERIDYAFIAGDVLLVGGQPNHFSNYLNQTCSCILPNRDMSSFWSLPADQRIWGFCMGNHEEMYKNLDEAAKGLGLDPSVSWYNNEVVMGHSYNYSVLRGNLLFIFMGGNRDTPEEYSYNLPTPGDFYWLEGQVSWADEQHVNVLIVTHSQIYNSSNSFCLPSGYSNHDVYYDVNEGVWKSCTHPNHYCDFDDPWPGNNSRWEECDDYWDLIENYQNINLWFNGHTHTCAGSLNPPPHEHAGWDTTLGVERDIQKSPYCTFVNLGAVYAWGFPWSNSRVLIFDEDSKDVKFKCFDHQLHSYGHEEGWESSNQDITITNCLKYPFNPDFNPDVLNAYSNGPYFGSIGKTIEINGDATGGKPPYTYAWDLDEDGLYNDAYGQNIVWFWYEPGIHKIKLKVADQTNIAYDQTNAYIGSLPPDKPEKPCGPTTGNVGEKNEYYTKTNDINDDLIYYQFSWGDNTNSEWVGPYNSGEICKTTHIWEKNGFYVVKVKAKDIYDMESDWSEPLPVVMPRYRYMSNLFFMKILKNFLTNWIKT